MPWLSEAKKDVTSCDKPCSGAHTRSGTDFRMGQPGGRYTATALSAEQTRGTETSQYPEEEKTKVIAQVVASERAGAQTGPVTAGPGLKDRQQTETRCLAELPGKAGRRG